MRSGRWWLLIACSAVVVLLWPTVFVHAASVQTTNVTASVDILGASSPPGFSPELLTVHVNDAILFTNTANDGITYQIAANDQSFASPPIAPRQQWTLTIPQTGIYNYHALAHADAMVGEILVVSSAATLLPTPDAEAEATAVAATEQHVRSTEPQPAASTNWPIWLIGGAALVLVLGGGITVVLARRRRGGRP